MARLHGSQRRIDILLSPDSRPEELLIHLWNTVPRKQEFFRRVLKAGLSEALETGAVDENLYPWIDETLKAECRLSAFRGPDVASTAAVARNVDQVALTPAQNGSPSPAGSPSDRDINKSPAERSDNETAASDPAPVETIEPADPDVDTDDPGGPPAEGVEDKLRSLKDIMAN